MGGTIDSSGQRGDWRGTELLVRACVGRARQGALSAEAFAVAPAGKSGSITSNGCAQPFIAPGRSITQAASALCLNIERCLPFPAQPFFLTWTEFLLTRRAQWTASGANGPPARASTAMRLWPSRTAFARLK